VFAYLNHSMNHRMMQCYMYLCAKHASQRRPFWRWHILYRSEPLVKYLDFFNVYICLLKHTKLTESLQLRLYRIADFTIWPNKNNYFYYSVEYEWNTNSWCRFKRIAQFPGFNAYAHCKKNPGRLS